MIENCTCMFELSNLPNQNNKLFQNSNVKLQRIVKVMEFVMVQEIVYAMIIGIQKQTALVFSKLYLV
jgi:hypothetical protein